MRSKLSFTLTKQVRKPYQPKRADVFKYLKYSILNHYNFIHISIYIVTKEESERLNYHYRNKNYPTNIISLEYSGSREEYAHLYGELILCDGVIVQEAAEQKKSIADHYAHMIIHGLLHLQGLEHDTDKKAVHMETLETQIMQKLGLNNPY